MWTRKELKSRARTLFKMNYWKAVLAALLLSIAIGGGSAAFSGGNGASSALTNTVSDSISDRSVNLYRTADVPETGDASIEDLPAPIRSSSISPLEVLFVTAFVLIIVLIVAAVAIVLNVLLINPLEVGIRRFFTRNLYEKAQIRELAFGFDHSYKNVIHVMFFRDLYTILWTLLFIIPGIVKSYEYRMIPYLLAEYPDMPKEDAFAISKYMMSGNKWKTFVLDLSFILWILGSVCTLGLLGLFYGNPYMAQTDAALYDALKLEKQPFAPQPDTASPFSAPQGQVNSPESTMPPATPVEQTAGLHAPAEQAYNDDQEKKEV